MKQLEERLANFIIQELMEELLPIAKPSMNAHFFQYRVKTYINHYA